MSGSCVVGIGEEYVQSKSCDYDEAEKSGQFLK